VISWTTASETDTVGEIACNLRKRCGHRLPSPALRKGRRRTTNSQCTYQRTGS
jgi:hypothetical protein